MDIGRSFTYMFEDRDWLKKIAIGGVLNIIPILNFIPIGYAIRALRRTAERRELPLPEWDDWGGDFVRGLLAGVVALFIYSLPMIILNSLSTALTAITDRAGDPSAIAVLCATTVACLSFIWGILTAFVWQVGVIKYATEGDFGAFFRFREIFRFISDHFGNLIIVLLISIVASIVAGIVGFILCLIGLAFTFFWYYLVYAHLLGQIRAEATPPLAPATVAPVPPTPPTYPQAPGPEISPREDEQTPPPTSGQL